MLRRTSKEEPGKEEIELGTYTRNYSTYNYNINSCNYLKRERNYPLPR